MTEQTSTPAPAEPTNDTIKLTFSFPDVITVGHYQTYQTARLKYINDSRDTVSNDMAAYAGARALIEAGVVHIKCGEPSGEAFVAELKAMIQKPDQTNTPISVMRLIGGLIASKVETESLTPFLFGKSFAITTDRQK